MRKKIQYIAALILCVSLTACAAKPNYVIGATSATQEVTAELAKDNKAIASVPVADERSSIMLLSQGQIQMAVVDAAVALDASQGLSQFAGSRVENLQTLVQFYPLTLQMVAHVSGEVFAVRAQKRLAVIGEEGGLVAGTVEPVLRLLGITNPQNVQIFYLEPAAALEQLKERKVDAILTLSELSDPTIAKALKAGCAFVDLSGRLIDDLPEGASDAAWTTCTVDKSVYDTPQDANTITLCSAVLAASDMPTDMAKAVTKYFLKNYKASVVPDIASTQPAFPYNAGSREALDEAAKKK